MSGKRLVLASNNPKKREELRRLLDIEGLEVLSLKDIENVGELVEDGDTFEDNALKKAVPVSLLTEDLVLADDSGLEIEVLGWRPGIHSARFAGDDQNDGRNIKKVLDLMRGMKDGRHARFRCVIAMAHRGKALATVEGICSGSIGFEERGDKGFGYDPIFIPEGETLTFAELSSESKDKISHRNRAINQARPYIEEFFKRRDA